MQASRIHPDLLTNSPRFTPIPFAKMTSGSYRDPRLNTNFNYYNIWDLSDIQKWWSSF